MGRPHASKETEERDNRPTLDWLERAKSKSPPVHARRLRRRAILASLVASAAMLLFIASIWAGWRCAKRAKQVYGPQDFSIVMPPEAADKFLRTGLFQPELCQVEPGFDQWVGEPGWIAVVTLHVFRVRSDSAISWPWPPSVRYHLNMAAQASPDFRGSTDLSALQHELCALAITKNPDRALAKLGPPFTPSSTAQSLNVAWTRPSYTAIAYQAAILLSFAVTVLALIRVLIAVRALRRHDRHQCTRCGYPLRMRLSDTPDHFPSACPECGSEVVRD